MEGRTVLNKWAITIASAYLHRTDGGEDECISDLATAIAEQQRRIARLELQLAEVDEVMAGQIERAHAAWVEYVDGLLQTQRDFNAGGQGLQPEPITQEALADAWMEEYRNALALTYTWTDERDLKRQIHRATAAAVLRRLAELEAHHDTE